MSIPFFRFQVYFLPMQGLIKSLSAGIAVLLCSMALLSARADVVATNMSGPQQVTWQATGVTVTMYQVEAAPDLTSAWKAVAQLVPTGAAHSARFNTTNDALFYRAIAVTSTYPRTRHEMVLVPGSVFRMGNTFSALGEGWPNELPLHDVPVNSFLMDKFEVTNEKLAEVFQWAYTNNLLDVQTDIATNTGVGFTNVVTNLNARVVNREGTTQLLYRADRSWSEVRFTNGQFYVVSGRSNFPAVGVTWYGAQAYANYRSDLEGLPRAIDFAPSNWAMNITNRGYRLPTEAEWEKAARGGVTNTHFPWPNDSVQGTNNYLYNIDPVKANYWDSRYVLIGNMPRHPWSSNNPPTTPVGYYNGQQSIQFTNTTVPSGLGADAHKTQDMVNAYGLYDMAGNAMEWCWDFFGPGWYTNAAASAPDPQGETNSALIARNPTDRVLRGGSWAGEVNLPGFNPSLGDSSYLRCAYRSSGSVGQMPSLFVSTIGFRLVRSIR